MNGGCESVEPENRDLIWGSTMAVRIAILLLLILPSVGCFRNNMRELWSSSEKPNTGPIENGARPATGQNGAVELPGKQSAELCLRMAESLEAEGKDADAVPYYEKARLLDPSWHDRVSRRLAVVYDRLDEQSRAMKEFQEQLQKFPKDSVLLCDIGYSYYNRGQWADAENHLRKAVSHDKNNKRAWVNLGMALAQQNKTNEALEAFEKGVTAAEARSNLAFILAVRGKTEEAKQAYRAALQLEPALNAARIALNKLENPEAAKNPRVQTAGASEVE